MFFFSLVFFKEFFFRVSTAIKKLINKLSQSEKEREYNKQINSVCINNNNKIKRISKRNIIMLINIRAEEE